MRPALACTFALLLALSLITSAAADAVFTVSVAQGAAPNLWEYTLTNNDASGKMLSLSLALYWTVDMSPGAPITIEGTPTEGFWVDDTDGSSYAAWINLTPDDQNPPPLAGQSLSGFIVGATNLVPYFEVEYYSIDDLNFEDPFVTGVLPVNSSAVPEPGSLAALAGGLCALPLLRRRKA